MTLTCAVTSSLHAGVGCRRSRLASPPRSPSSEPVPSRSARGRSLDWIGSGSSEGGGGGQWWPGRVFRHPVTGSLPRNRPRNRVIIPYAPESQKGLQIAESRDPLDDYGLEPQPATATSVSRSGSGPGVTPSRDHMMQILVAGS